MVEPLRPSHVKNCTSNSCGSNLAIPFSRKSRGVAFPYTSTTRPGALAVPSNMPVSKLNREMVPAPSMPIILEEDPCMQVLTLAIPITFFGGSSFRWGTNW
eukprot:CAMPEP_0113932106 /NCGR_PEP_ID=MMETSP1159-20121227/6922_1 /TAXON_ID=88271 /ORGANISM="Picocystis salinarum" /LENGTH=100 /DNA_ID=CAMNT_0000933165 /DNA_START=38 /DNA_END=337 /DNA_ORIENTATION=- /assembly_acc=CAM_ASM_000767